MLVRSLLLGSLECLAARGTDGKSLGASVAQSSGACAFEASCRPSKPQQPQLCLFVALCSHVKFPARPARDKALLCTLRADLDRLLSEIALGLVTDSKKCAGHRLGWHHGGRGC